MLASVRGSDYTIYLTEMQMSGPEVINRKSYRQNFPLFTDDGVDYAVWLPLATDRPEIYLEAIRPVGLTKILDELMDSSQKNPTIWTPWKHEFDEKDFENYHTSDLEIPITKDSTKFRLSAQHPFGDFKSASINLQVSTKIKALDRFDPDEDVIFVGPQAMWTPGSPETLNLELLNYPKKGQDIIAKPESEELGTYWTKFVKAAVAAHAQFVPVKDIAAETVES